MGLYAFPRVGRGDPSLANSLRDGLDAAVLDGLYGDASPEDYNGESLAGVVVIIFG